MNAYSIEFISHCPTNGVRVKYALRIDTDAMLSVEMLLAEVEAIEAGEPAFHEDIADRLAARFRGRHLLKAHHHGVDIETMRDGVDPDSTQPAPTEAQPAP